MQTRQILKQLTPKAEKKREKYPILGTLVITKTHGTLRTMEINNYVSDPKFLTTQSIRHQRKIPLGKI